MSMLSIFLLQADATAKTANNVTSASDQISLAHLLAEGGVLMIPLLLCSLLMVYIFVERLLAIRKAGVSDPAFVARITDMIQRGEIQNARATCKSNATPLGRVLEKGVSRIGKPIDHVEKAMENAGKLEVYQWEKNLSILSTLAGIAPMFGFLGTIAGMIILFFNVQHQGFSLETIAGGIYTKMVTSATGLIIGLLSYVGYAYLNAQINKNVNGLETASVEFLDLVSDQTAA